MVRHRSEFSEQVERFGAQDTNALRELSGINRTYDMRVMAQVSWHEMPLEERLPHVKAEV